jgi:ATP phosphoribosyltransferase
MFALQKNGLHVMNNVCVNQKGLRVMKMFAQTKKCSCIRKTGSRIRRNVKANQKRFVCHEKMFAHQEKC